MVNNMFFLEECKNTLHRHFTCFWLFALVDVVSHGGTNN